MDFTIIIVIGGVATVASSFICLICYYVKTCKAPEFEEVPVTGHPSGLSVIPVSINGYFLKSESTVLKLREKNFSWSGDDCTVKVLISVLTMCRFVIHYTAYCKKTFQSSFIFNHLLTVDSVCHHAGLTICKAIEKCVKKNYFIKMQCLLKFSENLLFDTVDLKISIFRTSMAPNGSKFPEVLCQCNKRE